MSRRIIGQCSTADFKDLQHLDTVKLEEVGLEYLNSRQKAAVMVMRHFQACDVPFKVAFKIKGVLIWEMPDKGLAFEYKLVDPADNGTRDILVGMSPRKLRIPKMLRMARR